MKHLAAGVGSNPGRPSFVDTLEDSLSVFPTHPLSDERQPGSERAHHGDCSFSLQPLHPTLYVAQYGAEHLASVERRLLLSFGSQGSREALKLARPFQSVHVEPDPDDHRVNVSTDHPAFDEDACTLSPIDPDVVGPLHLNPSIRYPLRHGLPDAHAGGSVTSAVAAVSRRGRATIEK